MKRYYLLALILIFVVFFACFAYCTDEAIIYGGYCYYIENGDIYRAPMTEFAGETELFRRDSLSISLDGSDLISISSKGDIAYYSLISDDELYFVGLEYLSSQSGDQYLLGSLSAKYESNGNPAAISKGNDAGGVSFGAYQFASNAGVPKTFAEWCISSGASIEIGNRLLAAYKNDGSLCGESFKAEWLAIAKENADLFLSVQHRFVKEKYYDAIVSRVEKNISGFDMDIYGIALQNVFWSRSVQHGVGGSYNVITRAFEALGGFNFQSEETLIRAIYAESGAVVDTGTYPMTGATAESLGIAGKYMKYYSKNSSAVQISVYKRLNINELALALEMLEKYGGYDPSDSPDYEFASLAADNITESSAKISATIKNNKRMSITEYGFFFGKSLNSLVDIPIFVGETNLSVISLSKYFGDSLESGSDYFFGVYAFIGGEYVTSEIFKFSTLKEVRFKVSYVDFDGTLLYEVSVKKGENAVFAGDLPSRPANAQYSYTFDNWDSDGMNISTDTVITAIYIKKDHIWDGAISSSFSQGDGSSASPYIISSAAELGHLSMLVKNGYKTNGKFFELSCDIVLGYGNSSVYFTPIGTEDNPFSGTFLGNGHKIIGLKVNEEKYSGLFGVVSGGEVDSLIIEDAEISGEIIGILAGRILSDSPFNVRCCAFSGVLNGASRSGGIAGECFGNAEFKDVSFSGKVTSKYAGGLFGYLNDSAIFGAVINSVTEGETNDAICAFIAENVSFSNCYYSDEDTSSVGKALSKDEMSSESSYLGLDFSKSWAMNDKCAVLKINNANTFEYYRYGDANGDGLIDVVDAVFLAQHLAAWKLNYPSKFFKASDINSDGTVSIIDSVLLAQYLAGWKISFMS